MTQRVSFLVDGFNLYHSVRDAQRVGGVPCCKWLDIRRFCASYLHNLGRDADLAKIFYFSALAHHLSKSKPDVVRRHKVFLEALTDSGVEAVLGRFKAKQVRCANCQGRSKAFEEKETDVAIAVKLLELLASDACDTVLLVTGDTDLAPAIRTAKTLWPHKRVGVVLPFNRANAELQQIADVSFKVPAEKYQQHLFPDAFTLSSGREIRKPPTW